MTLAQQCVDVCACARLRTVGVEFTKMYARVRRCCVSQEDACIVYSFPELCKLFVARDCWKQWNVEVRFDFKSI